MPEEVLKKYAGIYVRDKEEKEITFEFGRLWTSNGQNELKPVSDTKFVVIGYRPQVTFEFATNDEGLAKSYRVQQKENDIDKTYFREN